MTTRSLDAINGILRVGGDTDDMLRAVVEVLAEEPGVAWAGIAFLDDGELALGPAAGVADATHRIRVPVVYESDPVAELWLDGIADLAFLERVAQLVSGYCLVGWDTGGVPWDAA